MAPAAASALHLGGYSEPDPALHLLGQAAFVLALVVVGVLEHVQYRLRFLEARTWWASNGRDVLNAVALLLLTAALALVGFRGPLALVIAASVLILMVALQSSLSQRRHANALSVAVALALGAPVLFVPRGTDRVLEAALGYLFR